MDIRIKINYDKVGCFDRNESLYEFGNQASKNQQYFMFHHIRVKLPNSALIANHTEGPSNASFFRPLPE